MVNRFIFLSTFLLALSLCFGSAKADKVDLSSLQKQLTQYVATKDARIGVAVIINDNDTIQVNGNREFPMMSVFKFPLSLAVAQWTDSHGCSLDQSVTIIPEFMREDTYSPMLKKYGKDIKLLSLKELIYWAIVHSDNNACDILLNKIGGTAATDSILHQLDVNESITIGATEAEMDANHYLIYLNRSTPLAMVSLFNRFDREMCHQSASFQEIASMLEQCETGTDRLPAPLDDNTIIGHKTGTGFISPEGRLTALNDCGYVKSPDGNRYAIAVFVADSAYNVEESSAIIATISEMVYKMITAR